MNLLLNSPAPKFTLFSTEKKEISLTDYNGKNIVILFFPLSFTGVCTKELCMVRDELTIYNDLNAVVIGISVDSLFSLAKFKEEQKLNFDLLSDFNKEATLSYGALAETFAFGMKGVSKRSAFVVDKSGILKYIEILEDAGQIPNFSAIKDCLSSL